jgi:ribosomal protein L32
VGDRAPRSVPDARASGRRRRPRRAGAELTTAPPARRTT